MTSFEIVIWIYNLSLQLSVTPMGNTTDRFKIETKEGGENPMIVKYLPDQSWIAEKATMKFFTANYIRELGQLIERKKPEWFYESACI
jgi:hypothetical protein